MRFFTVTYVNHYDGTKRRIAVPINEVARVIEQTQETPGLHNHKSNASILVRGLGTVLTVEEKFEDIMDALTKGAV
jgi:hypothetical protein